MSDRQDTASLHLNHLSFLKVCVPFQWFLETAVKPALETADKTLNDVNTSKDAREIALHVKIALSGILDWPDEQTLSCKRALGHEIVIDPPLKTPNTPR